MKKVLSFVVLTVALCFFAVGSTLPVKAEEQLDSSENQIIGTSISITPVSKVYKLSADSVYDDILSVMNNGSEPIRFEVYAAPYSYIYSEENDSYSLGFSKENNYTQISRWISVLNTSGIYEEKPIFTANPGETVDVHYRITTPASVPDGGQYAVLFAHTLSDASNVSGVRTEASPGMVIYGKTDGESIIDFEVSDMKISQTIEKDAAVEENGKSIRKNTVFNHINASAKIKNNGNVDFNARGVLKVAGIFGGDYYETPNDRGIISVIPESELVLADEWEETPGFGIFKATWTVTINGESETAEMIVCLISPSVIIISIILLTVIIAWVIISVRKRKERRSRLSV